MTELTEQQTSALIDKVRALRESKGMSKAALSKAAGLSANYVYMLESGNFRSPGRDTLVALAKALDVPANEILMAGSEPLGDPVPIDMQAIKDAPRDVPVYSSEPVSDDPDGGMVVEAAPANWAARMAGLTGIVKAYAVYIPDDRMAPLYTAGDIVVLNPGRPPRAGDAVLVYADDGSGGERAYLRYLDGKDGGGVTLRDMDGGRMTIEKGAVKAIHRALSLTEVLGV